MTKTITWVGRFDTSSAWGNINTHLVAALEKQGWNILKNVHNEGKNLTPLQVYSDYPPRLPNVQHKHNLSYTSWEFEVIPPDYIEHLNQFDANVASCEWIADSYRNAVQPKTTYCHHGYDPAEFYPDGETMDWATLDIPEDATVVLWAGGTDKRHGFDIALKVLDQLPKGFYLVAKQSSHYPEQPAQHKRLRVIRETLSSLAPLYRAADVFLQSARAVGFSLPALEAWACGCPVVAGQLPPLMEYLPHEWLVDGEWVDGGKHHIHDCAIRWFEPDINQLVKTIQSFSGDYYGKPPDSLTWDAIAKLFGELLKPYVN